MLHIPVLNHHLHLFHHHVTSVLPFHQVLVALQDPAQYLNDSNLGFEVSSLADLIITIVIL